MKRYKFLNENDTYDALNQLRDAFLAAKDGNEVEEIINGLLTQDERLKIGRRILIAQYLEGGFKIEEITQTLKVGKNTISHVSRLLDNHPNCYKLIDTRRSIVEKKYQKKKYRKVGGSLKIFKTNEYTGYKRKDVKRKI